MKKKDIKALMDAQIIIGQEHSCITYKDKGHISRTLSLMEKGELVPKDIPELKDELDVLRDEMIRVTKRAKEAKEFINNIKCTHDVRLTQYSLCDFHRCVFCGESIYGNNVGNWELSRYRNAHCVNLVDINQGEADIDGGYSKRQVFEIINNIIKDKEDEDEIDLVEEFSKLNLPYCEINNKKVYPETYIMIIGGTNTYNFSNDISVTRKKLEISKTICEFLSGQLDTKVLVIDNPDVTDKIEETRDLEIKSYSTIDELNSLLKEYNLDFNLIIDISELYNYKIENNIIETEKIDLNLKEKYPSAKIIKINNLNKYNENESTIEETFQKIKSKYKN